MAVELERICYDKMERESMAYFYESQREIQRQLRRIRRLESALTENGISIPEEDWPELCRPNWPAELLYPKYAGIALGR